MRKERERERKKESERREALGTRGKPLTAYTDQPTDHLHLKVEKSRQHLSLFPLLFFRNKTMNNEEAKNGKYFLF